VQCACLRPSFCWYSLRLPMKGWPGRVDLGGWLHTAMVTHPSTNRAWCWLTSLIQSTMLPTEPDHKESIYRKTITGPCRQWLVTDNKNAAWFIASHEYSLFAWLMSIAANVCSERIITRKSSYCFQRVLAIAILSICLSVRPSHGWISQKQCKLWSPNLHHRLPGRL